jgi:hypothetical protein
VADPSPTTEQVAASKISVTIGGTWKLFPRPRGLHSTQPEPPRPKRKVHLPKVWEPRPPNSFGIQTCATPQDNGRRAHPYGLSTKIREESFRSLAESRSGH